MTKLATFLTVISILVLTLLWYGFLYWLGGIWLVITGFVVGKIWCKLTQIEDEIKAKV
jgi:hypothetical protein